MSLAGEAVTRLPAIVPRVRICGAPTSAQACASGSIASRANGAASTSLWVASAPSAIAAPVRRTYASSRSSEMSIKVAVGFDAALQLDHDVGPARDDARCGAVGREDVECLLEAGRPDHLRPHGRAFGGLRGFPCQARRQGSSGVA